MDVRIPGLILVLAATSVSCNSSKPTPQPNACACATGACCDGCNVRSSGYTCREANGVCDVAESCDGASAACPDDAFAGTDVVCREAAGPCDVAESCDGASAACPTDLVASTSVICRETAGPCDVAESCDGASAACPGDAVAGTDVVCREAAGPCDVAESCDGASAACPDDGYHSSETTCRAAEGTCDAAEVCSGSDAACPADVRQKPCGLDIAQQIAAVRAAADGEALDLPVEGAFVTYVKAAYDTDPAGFFVQGLVEGPALFVAVDPAGLVPEPEVGDVIDFVVTLTDTVLGEKRATAIADYARFASGYPVQSLVADASDAADLVSDSTAWESRAITLEGTLETSFSAVNGLETEAQLSTPSLTDAALRLRMPEALRAAYDLEDGCTVAIDYGVMRRTSGVAQPAVYRAEDFADLSCAAPTVVEAVALSTTEIAIVFDRRIDPSSVDPSDFVFNPSLVVLEASVNANEVIVTTDSPNQEGTQYTVTVSDLTSMTGDTVGTPNGATFQGFLASAGLLLNEINPNIGSSHDLVELLVTRAGSTEGIKLVQRAGSTETLATLPAVSVAEGDLIVVHLNPTTASGAAPASETSAKDEYASAGYAANYDDAWDFHGGATGLTNSNRVIELRTAYGALIDAAPFALSGSTSPALFIVPLQELQAGGRWLPADCNGSPCTYVSTPSAVDISVPYDGAGTTATGASIHRIAGANTMQKSDWTFVSEPSWGLANP